MTPETRAFALNIGQPPHKSAEAGRDIAQRTLDTLNSGLDLHSDVKGADYAYKTNGDLDALRKALTLRIAAETIAIWKREGAPETNRIGAPLTKCARPLCPHVGYYNASSGLYCYTDRSSLWVSR